MPQEKKLLDMVAEKLRIKHYSYQTEKTYIGWIKRYIFFHNKRHPKEMGKEEIEAFLTSLAVTNKVSASTQNQAFNALLFLYEQVLDIAFKDQNIQAVRAKQREHIPVVLTQEEVKSILKVKGSKVKGSVKGSGDNDNSYSPLFSFPYHKKFYSCHCHLTLFSYFLFSYFFYFLHFTEPQFAGRMPLARNASRAICLRSGRSEALRVSIFSANSHMSSATST